MCRIALQTDVIPIKTIFAYYKKSLVVIKRWPNGECPEADLDIAEPSRRREVLEASARIHQFLLQ
ncbi:2359_t:CDS:2 [Dentiscutata erythropus]|uniref:2359_t:CDS:1 n=1 Tax=Dentiscutata erythropus TaxID=1348616 RepID=A0A9N8Z4M9_9GLOM|nr:2359_t:CDS:2 [Dentiscutata erythropus]